MSERVLLIGLDMGDAALIEKWAQQGVLPTLRSLMTEGMWGTLATTAGVLHTSSWPTIFTGTLPGKHGVYYPYQPSPGRQEARHIGPDPYGEPPFWHILDQAGRRSIILDAPETYPAKGYNGVQIFEWGTWAWYWKRMTQPAQVEKELVRRFGPYPLKLEAKRLGLGMPDLAYLHSRLIASAAHKGRIAKWLMKSHPWDLFLLVFAETHPAGHYLWPKNGRGMEGPENGEMNRLRDVYAAVDAALGEVLKECGEEATVFVISGDGVAPNRCGWHLLPEVLTKLGFTQAQGNAGPEKARPKRSLMQSLRDAVPPPLRSAITSYLPWQLRDRLVSRLATANTDWSRSRAFCLPTDLEGCIRVNLRGREPQGIVEPGREYEEVCADLTESLKRLINPATGRAAVRQVWRIDELFPGERRHHLPDLTVIWNDEGEIRELYSDQSGLVSKPPVDPRTGTHCPRSFLAARGRGIPRLAMPAGGHIADLAPTLLSRFGITPPPRMDGRVLEPLL